MVEESSVQETIKETEDESAQLAEESVEEPVVETEEEVAVETMEERLTTLGLQGICVVVWNDSNEEEHVIEEGETYERVDGDRFFICTPSLVKGIDSLSDSNYSLGSPTENYFEVTFDEFDKKNEIEMKINCKNGEEASFNFSIMPPQMELGSDWAKALGYEEPKIVVWNDTTGLRKELEEGETYQLSKDDQVAMYTPESYIYDTSNAEQGNVIAVEKIAVLRWNLLDLGEKFDFEISAMHVETYDTITLHVTLLPPAE